MLPLPTETWQSAMLYVNWHTQCDSIYNFHNLIISHFYIIIFLQVGRDRVVGTATRLLATDWTAWVSNPGGGEIFRTRPDRSWDPPNFLYNG
jgi:hypothetical protein